MIGHVFETSGAVCLALAPSATRPDEYVVLAQYDGQYAVAQVLTAKMPDAAYWLRADYSPDRDEAVRDFAEQAGLTTDLDTLVANVEVAQQTIEHRAALTAHA